MELRYLFQVPNIAIRYLYTLQSDHHSKSSYHPSLHKDIALLLTMFPVLYITSPWLVCFITESLHFLIFFTYSTQSSAPLPSGNHQFILGIYDCLFCLVLSFVFFFQIPHTSVIIWCFSLSLSDLSHSVWYSQGPPMSLQMARFHSFLWPSCVCV